MLSVTCFPVSPLLFLLHSLASMFLTRVWEGILDCLLVIFFPGVKTVPNELTVAMLFMFLVVSISLLLFSLFLRLGGIARAKSSIGALSRLCFLSEAANEVATRTREGVTCVRLICPHVSVISLPCWILQAVVVAAIRWYQTCGWAGGCKGVGGYKAVGQTQKRREEKSQISLEKSL